MWQQYEVIGILHVDRREHWAGIGRCVPGTKDVRQIRVTTSLRPFTGHTTSYTSED